MLKRLLYRNYRLFFLFTQKVRNRFTANGLMIMTVMCAAGIFGIDTRATLSFQVFSITLIMIAVALLLTLVFRPGLSIKRSLPDYATVGQPLQYSLHVSNSDNRAYKHLYLFDDLKNEFPDYDHFANSRDPLDKKRNRVDRFLGYPRLVNVMRKLRGGNIKSRTLSHIAERSDIEVKLELLPLRRGYIQFDNASISRTDPLGLCHARKSFELKNKLLVLPRLFKTPELDLPGHRIYQPGGTNMASLSGDSQEFVSLREYRPGDPLRSIHWRSYAKLGEPVVKEYQDEYFVRYGLVLDTFVGSNINHDTFENAVSVAASYMVGEREQDTLLDLMFIGNQAYRYTSGKNHQHINAILEVLACIEPETDSNLERLQDLLATHVGECCGIICVLLCLDPARRSLLQFLENLSIPVKAIVFTDAQFSDQLPSFTNVSLHFVSSENIQEDLEQLSTGQKAA